MPSITSWTRLEPGARNETMANSLQARIHDPLWLLTRQWQFGEFQGEDAGTPIRATLVYETSQIERYLPQRPNAASASSPMNRVYDQGVPLEVWVERESVRQQINQYRLAAEAGLHFYRLLGSTLAEKYRSIFDTHFPLQPPAVSQEQALDSASMRFLSVIEGRAIDGGKLRALFKENRMLGEAAVLPSGEPFDKVDVDDQTPFENALSSWLDWYDSLFSEPSNDSAWLAERMEYEFALSAPISPAISPTGEVVLTASEYTGGHLDWYAFEVDRINKLGTPGLPNVSDPLTLIPTSLRFRGMAAARFWEFEDAGVNFGGLEAAPEDLARLLLTEFMLVYGNDFFMIPLDLDIGSLCRITSLAVTNTFGEKITITATSQLDSSITPTAPWRMFCLSPQNEQPGSKIAPLDFLFLPPALGATLESQPIEEVSLMRDEMANIAWAIERVIEGPRGKPLDRFEMYQEARQRREDATASTLPGSGSPLYRLVSTVPDYWLPLMPVKQPGDWIGLKRQGSHDPLGQFLKADSTLNEREIPRAGVRLTRAYQYARWTDGSTHLWVGRRKRPSRGEGSSGLRFDVVELEKDNP
jgi:hypothetical protein